MASLTLGLLQMGSGIDRDANAHAVANGLARLAADGARFAFTPEMSGLLDRNRERAFAAATDEDADPSLAAAREAAAKHGLWVHLGSLAIKPRGAAKLVNRGFLIDGAGAIRARYDKVHLFDVDLPSGERYRESASYAAGAQAIVADTPWGRMGLSICYDLRFPRLYETLTGAGATILSVPSAFTRPTGRAHWHILLRARAIEAGAFVVAAAQAGVHADGRETYGHSLVVDPWGEVLLDMGDAPGAATVAIDLGEVATSRGRVPAIEHRRDVTLEVAP